MHQGAQGAACDVETGPRAYEAKDIGQEWIDYVWVELGPAPLGEGLRDGGSTPAPATAPVDATIPGRLFVASADPVGAIVPTMIDLTCAGGPVEYAPAPVEFEFAEGRFKTSYGWGSCASCSECYMHWTFSLDLTGQLEDGALVADLVLNETFHSGPMPIVSVRMEDVTASCPAENALGRTPGSSSRIFDTEPRLTCEPSGECGRLRYEGRE